jgi:hypothetical protein
MQSCSGSGSPLHADSAGVLGFIRCDGYNAGLRLSIGLEAELDCDAGMAPFAVNRKHEIPDTL